MIHVPTWSIAIFACRETLATLTRCVQAAKNAVGSHDATIDVLINGNNSLAEEATVAAAEWQAAQCQVRIWKIEQGDKAHAWNEYLYKIWTPGTIAFFLDAYAEAQPQALAKLAAVFDSPSCALAATAVPSEGRSAAWQRDKMLREGGLQGNLHALGIPAMTHLRASGFRLPLGLYRTDSLINAVLNFNFDPTEHRWDTSRVAVVAEASWNVHGVSQVTSANIRGKLKRMVRQSRGLLENRAVREHLAVRRRAPQSLPVTAHELVNQWLHACPGEARSLFLRAPLTLYAAHQFNTARDWSAANHPPVCMTQPLLAASSPAS